MERRRIAERYQKEIVHPEIILPYVTPNVVPVWHIFGIRCNRRNELDQFLNKNNIGTNRHYPIPMHMQECYKELNISTGQLPIAEEISATELSLPLY